MNFGTLSKLMLGLLVVSTVVIGCGSGGGSDDSKPAAPTGTNPNAQPPSQGKVGAAPLPPMKKN